MRYFAVIVSITCVGVLYGGGQEQSKSIDQRIQASTRKLSSDNSALRIVGLRELIKIEDKKTLPELIRLLKDKHNYIRLLSIKRLGELRFEEAVTPLIYCLKKEQQAHIQHEIIKVLGALKSERSRLILEELSKDLRVGIRSAAKKSLEELDAHQKRK